jgi:hypothetical protein
MVMPGPPDPPSLLIGIAARLVRVCAAVAKPISASALPLDLRTRIAEPVYAVLNLRNEYAAAAGVPEVKPRLSKGFCPKAGIDKTSKIAIKLLNIFLMILTRQYTHIHYTTPNYYTKGGFNPNYALKKM